MDIVDAFRKLCPKIRLYTFFQGGSIPKSRLDRLYISNDICGKIISVKLESNPFSDHKILRVELFSKIERGPGTWIFNTSLLRNELFVNNIRNIIDVYKINREEFPTVKVAWDFCKMEVNNIAKNCSKKIASEKQKEVDNIRHEIEILQSFEETKMTQVIKDRIQFLKGQENYYINNKIKGAKLKAKVPHIEDGEIDISYYTKLEKRKGEENSIFSLYTKENECSSTHDRLLQNIDRYLTDEARECLNKEINQIELKESMLSMKNSKSPGSDGLGKEFHEFFWDYLCDFYENVIKDIFETDELSKSQQEGLIKIAYTNN